MGAVDGAADLGNHPLRLTNDLRVQSAQELVHLQVLVVPVWGEAHRLVGADQAAEAVRVGRRRRHPFSLVDDQSGQVAVPLVQAAQFFDQFDVGVPMCAGAQDALCREEQIWWDDAFECSFLLDPHVGGVDHPMLL